MKLLHVPRTLFSEVCMAASGLFLAVIALGGCALLAIALLGVVWVIVNERRSASQN
jgi:hypothetical protein